MRPSSFEPNHQHTVPPILNTNYQCPCNSPLFPRIPYESRPNPKLLSVQEYEEKSEGYAKWKSYISILLNRLFQIEGL